MANSLYSIRPHPQSIKAKNAALRVYVSHLTFLSEGFKVGQICRLTKDGFSDVYALIYESPDRNIDKSIIQTSRALQECSGLRLHDKVTLNHGPRSIDPADHFVFREMSDTKSPFLRNQDTAIYCRGLVIDAIKTQNIEYLSVGHTILSSVEPKRTFQLESAVNSSSGNSLSSLFRFDSTSSKIKILTEEPDEVFTVPALSVKGLETQVKRVNNRSKGFCAARSEGTKQKNTMCVLFHGPSGTGKTQLLEDMSQTEWGVVTEVHPLANTSLDVSISRAFKRVETCSRSVIILDNLHRFGTLNGKADTHVIDVIENGLKSYAGRSSRLVFLAATRVKDDIDDQIRKLFDLAVELPVPKPDLRADILRTIFSPSCAILSQLYESVGRRAHGYTGGDLHCVYLEARDILCETFGDAYDTKRIGDQDINMFTSCLDKALASVTPSALQEITPEKPNVKWSDVGGVSEVRKTLEQAFDPEVTTKKYLVNSNYRQSRGLLLYGPPGCSKTFSAKAFATSSDINFILIKGPELLNKYVGESERAIRRMFQKARDAQPCILFIDEIDAIGTSRDSQGSGSLQVVSTLLNELDGFESAQGVSVIAATNRPEDLDKALIRSGRFTRAIYLGPPKEAARREILEVCAAKMRTALNLDLSEIAKTTKGFTAAEIADICNFATLEAYNRGQKLGSEVDIDREDFLAAKKLVAKSVSVGDIDRYKDWAKSRGEEDLSAFEI